MTVIREEFQKYHDYFGFLLPRIGEESGNGLLFTAEEIITLRNRGLLDPSDRTRVESLIRLCEVRDRMGFPIRGLWIRHPNAWSDDLEGPDDHFGVAAMSRILQLPFAQEWLDYGLSTHGHWGPIKIQFIFNNQAPGVLDDRGAAWFGRFPALVAAMEWAAGRKPPLWRRLWLAISIITACFAKKEDTDARTLTWCALAAVDGQDWIVSLAEQLWLRALYNTFPNGMKDVFTVYFSPDHPLARNCITEKPHG